MVLQFLKLILSIFAIIHIYSCGYGDKERVFQEGVAQCGDSKVFTISSWNIMHGGFKFGDIEQAFKDEELKNSDIVAMQEAIETYTSVGAIDTTQPKEIASILNAQYVITGNNAIISKFPILEFRELIINNDSQRSVTYADIDVVGTVIRVYSIHLTYKDKYYNIYDWSTRRTELENLLDSTRNFYGPIIIAGDFNSVGKVLFGDFKEPAINTLIGEGYTDCMAGIEDNRTHLMGRLDWIFARGITPVFSQVGDFDDGSDHRWLLMRGCIPGVK